MNALESAFGKVYIYAPQQNGLSPNEEKARVRKGHLVERDLQLNRRAVFDFVKGMERQRLTDKDWYSIFSVMRDGRDLTEQLRDAASAKDENTKSKLLAQALWLF